MSNATLDTARLENVKQHGAKLLARCPACAESDGDREGNHLFINAGGAFGCVKYPGNAGTEHRKRIFALVGIPEAPTRQAPTRTSKPKTAQTWPTAEDAAKACTPKGYILAAVYHYPLYGKPFSAVGRYEDAKGKTFRQFSLNGTGWKAGAPSGAWPLYAVASLPESGPVYVVEGEKCQHAAALIGLPVVTSAGGSGAAAKSEWTPLKGRDVYLLPDNDDAGKGYAEDAASICHDAGAASVKSVTLPGLPVKGDIADFVAMRSEAGLTPEEIRNELESLATNAPEWTPPKLSDDGPGKTNPIEAARNGTPYAMTDLGNAERLCAWHGDAIRWDIARKCWRVWDGQRWAADSALRVNTLAADTARKIRREASACPTAKTEGGDLGLKLFQHAVKSESRDRLAAMVEVAKARPGIAVAPDDLDADPWALNVANGTLDLHTGTLRPHNRADLLTKLAPVEYHPGRRCERWQRFLDDATGNDADLIDFLQILAGYTLTGDTSEEKLFLVYGPEASGKTTFLESLRSGLGEYARTIQADLLTRQRDSRGGGAASPELAGLAGARMAAGSEMEQGREIAEALAKNLTGGEPITARHLYAELFDFRPQFKLWLALNHCPKVSADDGAIWRRILRIGFEHSVPPERRDKTLKPYLRDPDGGAPAVLAWAVEGCLRWQREGLNVPDAVARSTAAYRQESDPLAAFIEDCLSFTPYAWTTWSEIWRAYNEHAGENGTAERFRVAPRRLQERLKAHDCESERRKIGRGWLGVELVHEWHGDASDASDATSQSFSSFSSYRKVLEKVSPPSPPSPNPAELDFEADYLAEERRAIMEECEPCRT